MLRLAFGLAVRHEVIPRNPMDGIARLHKPPHTPDALTPADVDTIRLAVRLWEKGGATSKCPTSAPAGPGSPPS